MREQVNNQNIIDIGTLVSPREVKTHLPLPNETKDLVLNARQEIRNILQGRDRDRLLVIAGPCSIHDPDAAYEFAQRLQRVSSSLSDRMLIVMRTYFEKPRTTVGWKGLINDPHLDGSCMVEN